MHSVRFCTFFFLFEAFFALKYCCKNIFTRLEINMMFQNTVYLVPKTFDFAAKYAPNVYKFLRTKIFGNALCGQNPMFTVQSVR